MMNFKNTVAKLILLGLFPLAMTACSKEPVVSFSRDVRPILDQNCIECHLEGGQGHLASGFNMATYDDLMRGTKFGPMIVAGDPEGSNLVVLIEGRADPSIAMPHGKKKSIPKEDIRTIRLWISQGAKNN